MTIMVYLDICQLKYFDGRIALRLHSLRCRQKPLGCRPAVFVIFRVLRRVDINLELLIVLLILLEMP